MRGNRVRNIVSELQGEKIDIVRYNEDIREYIRAALSPAKIAEIKLNKDALKAEVIVDDDQLSLAIGKHGQNVRLASRLIGWELDIRTKAMIAEQEAKEKKEEVKAPAIEQPETAPAEAEKKEGKKARKKKEKKQEGVLLSELNGVGEKTLESLKEAGIETVGDLLKTDIDTLLKVKGVGEKKAEKLIAEAKKLKV